MKQYIKPNTTTCEIMMQQVMVSVSGGNITYGGVDSEGSLDVDSKERDWEEM